MNCKDTGAFLLPSKQPDLYDISRSLKQFLNTADRRVRPCVCCRIWRDITHHLHVVSIHTYIIIYIYIKCYIICYIYTHIRISKSIILSSIHQDVHIHIYIYLFQQHCPLGVRNVWRCCQFFHPSCASCGPIWCPGFAAAWKNVAVTTNFLSHDTFSKRFFGIHCFAVSKTQVG